MALNFLSQKLIGFSVNEETIRYALISVKQGKIIVAESKIFSPNCKAALHRLQHLLKLYPSCQYTSSCKTLLASGPEDIRSKKDQRLVVKNKIESLLQTNDIKLNSLDGLSLRAPTYMCVRENDLEKLREKNRKLSLDPQKLIDASQALLSLELFFYKDTQDKALIYSSGNEVLALHLSKKRLKNYTFFSIKDCSPQKVIKRVLKECFMFFPERELAKVFIHSLDSFKDELEFALRDASYLQVEKEIYGPFEPTQSQLLLEIGAAVSLLKIFNHNFFKNSALKALKIYQRPLLIHLALITTIFLLSLFSWGLKMSQIKTQNSQIVEKSFSELGEKLSNEVGLDSVSMLKNLLQERKKTNPNFHLSTNNFTVTETLMWISNLFNKIKEEHPSPFIIEDFKYIETPSGKNGSKTNQVKVAITFSATNTLVARRVYNEICKSKQVVDISKKVDWHYQNNLYQVAFFLKSNKEPKDHA